MTNDNLDFVANASAYSTLRQWMEENRDDFAKSLPARPSWTKLAKHFADMGLRGRHDSIPTASIVRQTWETINKPKKKIKKDIKAQIKNHTPITEQSVTEKSTEQSKSLFGLASLYRGKR